MKNQAVFLLILTFGWIAITRAQEVRVPEIPTGASAAQVGAATSVTVAQPVIQSAAAAPVAVPALTPAAAVAATAVPASQPAVQVTPPESQIEHSFHAHAHESSEPTTPTPGVSVAPILKSPEEPPSAPSDVSPAVKASEQPASAPTSYRVVGISTGDYLNVRQGPGSNYEVVARLGPGQRGIIIGTERVMNGTTVWQKIAWPSGGWINVDYLSPDTR